MRIVFVDDMIERRKLFARWCKAKGHDVTFAIDYRDALFKLPRRRGWDMTFLDHDLADQAEIYYDSSGIELTGTHLAKWIVVDSRLNLGSIVIHSRNAYGAARMNDIFRSRGIIPHIAPFGKALKRFL